MKARSIVQDWPTPSVPPQWDVALKSPVVFAMPPNTTAAGPELLIVTCRLMPGPSMPAGGNSSPPTTWTNGPYAMS